jgi:hypothetical protein
MREDKYLSKEERITLLDTLSEEEWNRRFDPGQMPALVIDALNHVGCDTEEFATLARSIREIADEKNSLLLFMKKGTLQCQLKRKN